MTPAAAWTRQIGERQHGDQRAGSRWLPCRDRW